MLSNNITALNRPCMIVEHFLLFVGRMKDGGVGGGGSSRGEASRIT